MAKHKTPVTPAVRLLRNAKIAFEHHPYDYVDHGGTVQFARELGVAEHCVIKTLIMQDENTNPLVVLMYGDCEVSTKALARQIGCKSIHPCEPKVADRHSGYQVGGTSPFGTRRKMPVYCEAGILELTKIYINGGKRGYIISLEPSAITRLLHPVLVEAIQ